MEADGGFSGGMQNRGISAGMIGTEMKLHGRQQTPFDLPNHRSLPPQRNFSPLSPQDEFRFGEDAAVADAAKRVSQPESPSMWQRMKWTDNTVRLLVWVVHSIGEDGAVVDCSDQQQKGKRQSSSSSPAAAGAMGIQLKKGKWKSVSRVMMEKGFCVSPQQCEDKFNDLNKRYKRVNELLGKGTACKIVENPALLDSMDLPRKAKEEARKLLISKHLFFREMCAYHNACPPAPPAMMKDRKDAGSDEEEEDDYSEEESDDGEDEEGMLGKRKAAWSPLSLSLCSPTGSSSAVRQVRAELMGVPGEEQKKQWLRMRRAELEEQGVFYKRRALQLERQRFKWLRFSSNKEREMEKTRLQNERFRLENERMLLLLQEREIRLRRHMAGKADAAAAVSNGFHQFAAVDRGQN